MTGRSANAPKLTPAQEKQERANVRLAAAWIIVAAIGLILGAVGSALQ